MVKDVFPIREDGLCACGCGAVLKGKQKRWSSKKCSKSAVLEFRIQKGDVKRIRQALLKRDKAICAHCQEKAERWEADHILAVVNGGGGVGLNGYQTLCIECHKKKTRGDLIARDESRK